MATSLVTGRNGFIGQELVPALKKTGRVVSVVRQVHGHIDYADETLIVEDVRRLDAEQLRPHHIDTIVHLAAQVRGRASALEHNNVASAKVVFDIAQRLKVPVVFVSSTNVLFAAALGGYARSKQRCEDLLKGMGIDHVTLRIPLVLGEKSSSMRSIRGFYRTFKCFPLFGRQAGKVQPVHISSLTAVLLATINNVASSHADTVNVVGREPYAYREIIEQVIGEGSRVRFIEIPQWLSMFAARSLEMLGIPFVVSSEEIRSVNMHKLVGSSQEPMCVLDNDRQLLFGTAVIPSALGAPTATRL